MRGARLRCAYAVNEPTLAPAGCAKVCYARHAAPLWTRPKEQVRNVCGGPHGDLIKQAHILKCTHNIEPNWGFIVHTMNIFKTNYANGAIYGSCQNNSILGWVFDIGINIVNQLILNS